MTVQVEEKIIINDKVFVLLSRPLEPFLKLCGEDIKLIPYGSHCWRGYVGEWTILNNVLYLTHLKLQYHPKDEEKLMPLILEGATYQATWYTGELRVPFGKAYQQTTYHYPLHEKEMLFTVEKGLITNHVIIENEEPEYEDNGLPL